MINFLKNLFRRKEEDFEDMGVQPFYSEHYVKDGDIHVYVDRDNGMIRVEAPQDVELSKEDIIDICREFYED